MERRLYETLVEGNLTSLLQQLEEDPLLIDKYTSRPHHTDSPLHIASVLGHTEMVNEIVNRKPELACQLNSDRSTPLHLASAKGYVGIAQLLLGIKPEMTRALDRYGMSPVHVAAAMGRVYVLRELVRVDPESVQVLTGDGLTVLLLCVKYNQLEALKVLLADIPANWEFVNAVDNGGNSVLHLAVLDKQYETVDFLTEKTLVDIKAINAYGLTAMDILEMHRKSTNSIEDRIGFSLGQAGGASTSFSSRTSSLQRSTYSPQKAEGCSCITSVVERLLAQQEEWTRERKEHKWIESNFNAIMVTASVMTTMAFQAGVNPPGGFWQDTTVVSSSSDQNMTNPHIAGQSILATTNPAQFNKFVTRSTIGLVASTGSFILILSGLPFNHKVFVRLFMVAMWVATVATATSYHVSLTSIVPEDQLHELNPLFTGVSIASHLIWAVVIFGHTIIFLVKVTRKARRCWKEYCARGFTYASFINIITQAL